MAAVPEPPPPPPAAPPPPSPAHRERRWLPVLAVAAVIVVVLGGGLVAAAAVVPAEGPGEEVGAGVRVAPASGWQVAEREDGHLRLTKGSATLDVFVLGFQGGPADLFGSYVREALQAQSSQLTVGEAREVRLSASGLAAVEGSYVGIFPGVAFPVEGLVVAAVTPDGRGVVFDAWGAQGQLAGVVGEVATMIDGTTV